MSAAGWYELWWAHDGSESSLFRIADLGPEAYHVSTHALGDDPAEDIPMERVLRFWAPSWRAAKAVARVYAWWRSRRTYRSDHDV